MKTLFITKKGLELKKKGERIIVDETEVPFKDIKEVIIQGSVGMTSSLTRKLLEYKIPVHYLSYYGNHIGHLLPRDAYKQVKIHQKQFRLLEKEELRLETSKIIVKGKLNNMRSFIMRSSRSNNSRSERVMKVINGLKKTIADLESAEYINQIRGYEGTAARKYFSIFPKFLKDSMNFTGRNKRPPKDPVNSMLSYGYTLLYNKVLDSIYKAGLNPYVGAYHDLENGRASLACDLMEEYRQILIDSLVKKMINREMVSKKDFVKKNNKILMSKKARESYLTEFNQLMEQKRTYSSSQKKLSWEEIISKQALRYKKHLLDQNSYLAMGVR